MKLSSEHLFNPEESFFVLDSDKLNEVESGFYGYTLFQDQIIGSLAGLAGREPSPEGVYVFIQRNEDQIRIMQDFLGCYGLYLYQDGSYFALSNSFLRLMEYVVSIGHPITLNREFAEYLLFANLCSSAFSETAAKEISVLDRSAVVHIDIPSTHLSIALKDYQDNTVDPASAEGLAILDAWRDKWCARFREGYQYPGCLRTDLSGGFDTRVCLALLLSAGIDPGKLFICSHEDNLHTHTEDYLIASKIADHYGFSLNNKDYLNRLNQNYYPEDIIGISFYSKLGFCKHMHYKHNRHLNTWYTVTGKGGGPIRNIFPMTEEEFILNAEQNVDMLSSLSPEASASARVSTRKVLERTFAQIHEKYASLGRPIEPGKATAVLYRETRCRTHFGKQILEEYFANTVSLSPLIDPDLYRLALTSDGCNGDRLIYALIFDRYAPDLLNFEFEGGRSFQPEELSFAREVNKKYPFVRESEPAAISSAPILTDPPEKQIQRTNLPVIEDLLFRSFLSEDFQQWFGEAYDRSVFISLLKRTLKKKYHPIGLIHCTLGVESVVWASHTKPDSMRSFIQEIFEHSEEIDEEPRMLAEQIVASEGQSEVLPSAGSENKRSNVAAFTARLRSFLKTRLLRKQ